MDDEIFKKRYPRTTAQLTGKTVGFLQVQHIDGHDKHRAALWKCICICGKVIHINTGALISGRQRSCGCQHSNRRESIPKPTMPAFPTNIIPLSSADLVNRYIHSERTKQETAAKKDWLLENTPLNPHSEMLANEYEWQQSTELQSQPAPKPPKLTRIELRLKQKLEKQMDAERAEAEMINRFKSSWDRTVAQRQIIAGVIEPNVIERNTMFDSINDCIGHVASESNPKICGRCGVCVDDLRPPDDS